MHTNTNTNSVDALDAAEDEFRATVTLLDALIECLTNTDSEDYKTVYLPRLIERAAREVEGAGNDIMEHASKRIKELQEIRA